jgi:hemoglobin
MSDEIISRYGRAKLNKMVAHFYANVVASPNLAAYFEDVAIRTLVDHQAAFMEGVMGGPAGSTETQLEAVHSPLRITDVDFDHLIAILRASLEHFDVEPEHVDIVMSRYRDLKPLIVSR